MPLFEEVNYKSGNLEQAKKKELIKYIIQINRAMGVEMTQSEIQKVENELESSAQRFRDEGSSVNIYDQYLKEMQEAIDMDELSSYSNRSSGEGTTRLPTASTGDIFFTDNNMPYNHVGIYTSKNRIVEAMPNGVKHLYIYEREAFQSPNNTSNDSCILSVTSASYSDKNKAANWAKSQDGKPYDINFMNNKKLDSGNDKFNCSELVWKAYKATSDIDLDSNGGSTVYPNNIYNSNEVEILKRWG